MERVQRLQNNIAEWSDAAFGVEDRTVGILNHLREELEEVLQAREQYEGEPTGVNQHRMATEFADCLILLLDAARKSGLNTDLLLQAAEYKMKINRDRKWNPANEQGYHKHK